MSPLTDEVAFRRISQHFLAINIAGGEHRYLTDQPFSPDRAEPQSGA